MSISAVILAGGQGTRIRHLLPDLPKPMAPVGGRPFLEWVVRFLARQGVSRMMIGTGFRAEKIADYFAAGTIPGVDITCVAEASPQGTAGGFLAAIAGAAAPEAWLVCNGDSLVLASLQPLFRALDDPGCEGAVLGIPMEDASRYGRLECGEDGFIRKFVEKQPGRGLVNAGVYLLRPELAAMFPKQRPLSFEADVFPALLAAGRKLRAVPIAGPFLDIGTPETLEQAGKFIEENEASFGVTR